MSSRSPPRRRFRLQVSLRVLLLLMLLVGVGLTIYRWPWVETIRSEAFDPFGDGSPSLIYEHVTYRRNWRGEPMRHGPSQRLFNGELYKEENYYDGKLQGATKWFHQGKVSREDNYREGQPHGVWRIGDGQSWVTTEEFAQGFRHGPAQYLLDRGFGYYFNFDRELNGSIQQRPAVAQFVRGTWQRNQRHGKWTWTTEGTVTHTEEFEHDEIVRWDGKPIVEEFWKWLREQNDPQLLAELTEANLPEWYDSRRDRQFTFGTATQRVIVSTTTTASTTSLAPAPFLRGRLIPGMCEFAARNRLAFAYRYGGLWLIPPAERDVPFVDPTGVSEIEFSAGSPQAAAWNELIDVVHEVGYDHQCVAELLAGSPIEYRCENLSTASRQRIGGGPPPLLFTRRRRDALAYVLFQTGCRCELQGAPGQQVLRVVPQAERTQEQTEATPLSID